ncbi:MAG: amidohydrolase family protein [Desulfovermiculus sp.]|nr:amidohydrolase family protein [Desulfovermiculus sp.]
MSSLMLYNIHTLLSGNIAEPILQANALLIKDGKIADIGSESDFSREKVDKRIDCSGTSLCPGLIDSHCHPVFGDYTPRQQQIGYLASEVHGGVTTFISAGEPHLPGRPKDRAGAKALAILAAKSFAAFRPGGAKVIGGSVILEKGLRPEDFQEMAAEGVRTVGEVGLGTIKDPEEAAEMIGWAKAHGMTVMMHTGGTSIPGSSSVTADMVMAAGPDVVSHINGGPTAVALKEVRKLVLETDMALEIVHCGNPRIALDTVNLCLEHSCLERIIIGNDAPSGTGVIPLGILRVLNQICSLSDLAPDLAVCMATGNTGRVHKLDVGLLEQGRPADLLIMDAPMGSVADDALGALKVGDVPGVGMVLVDGEVVVNKSKNTPPPKRMPSEQ